MPVKDTAATIKPHTEAKLQFYTKYLQRYLEILLRVSHIEKINIYDMFCGEGIYSDGNTGSAIRAVDAIWQSQSSNIQNSAINLHLNDLNKKKTDKLRLCLGSRQSIEKNSAYPIQTSKPLNLLRNLAPAFKSRVAMLEILFSSIPMGIRTFTSSR